MLESYRLLEKPEKNRFLLLTAGRLLVQLMDLVGLAAVGVLAALIASGLNGEGKAPFLGHEFALDGSRDFLVLVVGTVFFFVVKSALASFLLRLTTKFLAEVETRSAIRVMRSLFDGSLERLRKVSGGEHVWLSMSASNIAFSSMLFAGSAAITESFLFLSILAGFIIVNASSALIVAAYFSAVIFVYYTSVSWRLKKLGQRLAESHVRSNNAVLNLANAFREISVAEKVDRYVNKFADARATYSSERMLQRFLVGLPRFFVEAALMVGLLAIVLWQFVQGSLTEGLVTTGVFLTGGVRMMASLLPLQNAITEIRASGPEAEKAQKVLRELNGNECPAVELPQGAAFKEVLIGPLGVTAEDLSFRFSGAPAETLNSINFTINPGQLVAIVGPSGAGKTTLVDLLLGLLEPTSGSVHLEGSSPQAFRKKHPGAIAYVPQSPGVTSGTLAQNVSLSPDGEAINRLDVSSALERAGLKEFIDSLPDGIDTRIGERMDGLSGGQLQRLGIARALYSHPRLLVLDEATSALDAETEVAISRSVEALTETSTVIVIAHRLSTIQHADLVLVVEGGKITARGTFPEVRKKVPLIERYVQLMKVESS